MELRGVELSGVQEKETIKAQFGGNETLIVINRRRGNVSIKSYALLD